MKQHLYFLSLTVLLLLSSCQEESLKTFGDEHYIYFEKFYKDAVSPGKEKADSTLASFFFYTDNVNELEAQVVVNMAGRDLEKDEIFRLKVVPEMTTATSDEYKLADRYTFRARPAAKGATNRSDTIGIKMYRSARLKDIITLIRDAVKPKWWDKEVTDNRFGAYSSRKYKLFLLYIDPGATLNEEMLKTAPYKAIELVMKFKKWLTDHPDQAKEEDGSIMTVNV